MNVVLYLECMFCCHSDLVSGLIELMNSNYTRPVNLGNPDEHSILEFASIIKKQVGTYNVSSPWPCCAALGEGCGLKLNYFLCVCVCVCM